MKIKILVFQHGSDDNIFVSAIVCDALPHIPNAVVWKSTHTTGYEYTDEVVYKCDKGHKVSGIVCFLLCFKLVLEMMVYLMKLNL